MSGLDNLNTRVGYRGGKQQDRMINGKLASLKRALLYSYQAATAVLEDGREFRCLINPDKLKEDYDDKIISIPFEDICLNKPRVGKTSEGIETIGMKTGDTFTWKETDTKWLVYLQRLEEKAYFRAEIRKCEESIEINGKPYWFFVRRYGQEDALWHTTKGLSWNELNYSLLLYITKDEFTQSYFKRFQIIEFGGQPWEVQDINIYSTDGFVVVLLKEHYNNTIEEQVEQEKQQNEEIPEDNNNAIKIEGNLIVYPYDEIEYSIIGATGGIWKINGTKAKILNQTSEAVLVAITTGRSGEFELVYKRDGEEDIVTKVTIESL